MTIGVSGTFGAGKDTIAKYLMEKGWQHISCSDILREEAKKQNLSMDRDTIREFSNDMSKKDGPEALVKIALQQKNKENLVISSVRKPAEVDYLHLKNIKVIFVDAPIEERFERMKKRAQDDETKKDEVNFTLDDLKAKEEKEMSGGSSQVLSYCKEHSDVLIDNSKELDHLYKQIDEVING